MGRKLKSERARECRKKDLITQFPALSMEDGNPINVDQYLLDFDANDKKYAETISKFERKEKSTFSQVKWIELATLILAMLGMTLLIALAWLNF